MSSEKRILLNADLDVWTRSDTYNSILEFIVSLQHSVHGCSNDVAVELSPTVELILLTLDKVSETATNNPVVHEKDISRFGKVEFRDFYDQIARESPLWMEKLLPLDKSEYAQEVAQYFAESWGNRQRIDYGSGHELNFVCFLFCLQKLGSLSENDHQALVLRVFNRYMAVMRQLQKTYWLEPAGSHGVWGLDDYHFLPFLFGAAQLATHPHMKPKLIHNKELVEAYWKQYMYLECIHFLNSIKTVPGNGDASLRWHSPMLDDILSARLWAKIQDGMVKMYKAEVLEKLPIMQHLMFGRVITAPSGILDYVEHSEDECGHVHEVNTWGDCCGIKIPSAIAASQMNERPVPFD